jgi:DNA-binding MarR family transcriptional regulator
MPAVRRPHTSVLNRTGRLEVDDDAARVLRQFRQIFNAVKTHFQQVEKSVGLGGAQVWALSVVQQQPDIGIGALASALNIHPSTASNMVKALVQRGLLSTAAAAGDRRALRLRLLPAGAKVMRRAPGPYAGVLPEALAGLDSATLQRLEHDLQALIEVLGADRRSAKIPLGGT